MSQINPETTTIFTSATDSQGQQVFFTSSDLKGHGQPILTTTSEGQSIIFQEAEGQNSKTLILADGTVVGPASVGAGGPVEYTLIEDTGGGGGYYC
jgi:hypothetical protein